MPNRYLCSVLDEMRDCYKSRNFAHLLGLVEEAQWLANRMEAAISDHGDIERLRDRRAQAKDELKPLEQKVHNLKQEVESLKKKKKELEKELQTLNGKTTTKDN